LFILRAIFAFDRMMRRVPSLTEIWFFEFIFLMATGLGLGRLLDGIGVSPCPPAAGSIDGAGIRVCRGGARDGLAGARPRAAPHLGLVHDVTSIEGFFPRW
jgi:hypothetical protein